MFEASLPTRVGVTFMSGLLMVLITKSLTPSAVSPGRILKLMIALAITGKTFSFIPALIMVVAVVVRIIELVNLLLPNCCSIIGRVNQVLAKIIRLVKDI